MEVTRLPIGPLHQSITGSLTARFLHHIRHGLHILTTNAQLDLVNEMLKFVGAEY
jgi:hypothetical protein